MPGPIAPLIPVLLGLAVVWAGAAVVLYAGGRMRGRSVPWEVVTGFTLCAVGPVLPELGIAAAVAGGGAAGPDEAMAGGLVMGTALGSALARSTLALGLGAFMGATVRDPVPGTGRPPFYLLGVLLLAALALDGSLGRLDGAILSLAGLLHLGQRVRTSMREAEIPKSRYGILPDPFLIVAGLGILGTAAWLLAPHAAALADVWRVAPILPGLLVLGVGASLPELILGVDAAARGQPEMSTSSVLLNGALVLLAPLGLAAVLQPLPVPPLALRVDVPVLAVVVTSLWLLDRRGVGLSRRLGALLVGCFLTYAAARIVSV